ncbi:het domain-containing protein [Colletotrichum truncatum]|uniref:Het domain-containing protein n=1 Tax=Colletotrichum truncatum TaxID=5467 RepID=A0ACC3Z040_COLTU
MEHLPVPHDPIQGHPEIALATAQFHDPGPFLEYPERYGSILNGKFPHVPTQADAMRGHFSAAIASNDVIDYYQGWLFFSLVQEFLGDFYDMKNYTSFTLDDQGELSSVMLSTRTLHDDLASLRTSGPLASIRAGDKYHLHLEECLAAALDAFDAIDHRFPGFLKVFDQEMICLASVAEKLDSALQTALEHGPKDDMKSDIQYFPKSAKHPWFYKIASLLDPMSSGVKMAMINAGWCPGDISKIRDSFTSIDAFYYLSKFKADPTVADLHKDCQEYGCSLQVPAEPKHERPECDCPGMVTFEEEQLIEIYQKGDIPCFAIGKLDDGSFGIALISCSIDEESQKDPDNHYVALSHVWSEGMGNPQANSLPFCQLAYVMHWSMMAYQLVEEKLQSEKKSQSGITIQTERKIRQVNLWIDTMCCPATPGYGKNLCLSRMREIYANAYAVLVRSSILQVTRIGNLVQDTSKGIMDIAARIYLSPWMRRMWTLQEGVLAGTSRARGAGDRLCFAFSDSLLCLESVIGLLKQAPKHEAALAFRFIAEFRDLSVSMWRLSDKNNPVSRSGSGFFVQMIANALKYRTLTVASDEVICLATLLDLRINSTRGEVMPLIGDGQAPEDGMCELWRRIEVLQGSAGLPPDIIFTCVPRVQVPGFRWAPRTLVQYAKYGDLNISYSTPYQAKIEQGGLRVRFPGAKLTCLGAWDTIGRHLPDGKQATDGNQHELSENPRMGSEKATPRVLMVKIPPDGDQWYAVRVHDKVSDRAGGDAVPGSGTGRESDASPISDPKDDLVRYLKTGSAALIFQPGKLITGPGLLVSIETTPSTTDLGSALERLALTKDPLRVHSEFPVKIMPLADTACVIAEAARHCVRDLRQSVVAEARQRGEDLTVEDVWKDNTLMFNLLRKVAVGFLTSSDKLKEALYFEVLSRRASATDESALETFLTYVRQMAYFGGGMEGELYDEDCDWCVD